MAFDYATTGDEVVKAFSKEVSGKTILITGTTAGGIGAQTALFLAAGAPKHLILAGRSRAKSEPVFDDISIKYPNVQVTFITLDLADQASVRRAAKEIREKVEKLDIVINNAGLLWLKPYTTTTEGIELQFGTYHIGHFLLTNLIMDRILAAGPGSRIVCVSSFGYICFGADPDTANFDDYNFQNKAYNGWIAYGQSKTANILFASALATRLQHHGIRAFATTPGVVMESAFSSGIDADGWKEGAEIWTKSQGDEAAPPGAADTASRAVGAASLLYAALSPGLEGRVGGFVCRCQVMEEPLKPFARGKENEDRLWALSEKLVGEEFAWK